MMAQLDIKKGYLYKQSKDGRWKKRFVEVNGWFLSVYDSSKLGKLLAMVDLSSAGAISICKDNIRQSSNAHHSGSEAYLIKIALPKLDNSHFILRSKQYDQAVHWLELIRKTRDRSKGGCSLGSGSFDSSFSSSKKVFPLTTINEDKNTTADISSIHESGMDVSMISFLDENGQLFDNLNVETDDFLAEEKVQEEIRQIMTSPRSSPHRPQHPHQPLQDIKHVLQDGAINNILHLDETIPPFYISEEADIGDDCADDDILSPLSVLESVTPSPAAAQHPTTSNTNKGSFSIADHAQHSSGNGGDSNSSPSSSSHYWKLAAIIVGITLVAGVVTTIVVTGSVHKVSTSNDIRGRASPSMLSPAAAAAAGGEILMPSPSPSIAATTTLRDIQQQSTTYVASSAPVPTLSSLTLPLLPSTFATATPKQPAAVLLPLPLGQQNVEAIVSQHISPTAAFNLLVSSLKHATRDMFRSIQVKINGMLLEAKELLLRIFTSRR